MRFRYFLYYDLDAPHALQRLGGPPQDDPTIEGCPPHLGTVEVMDGHPHMLVAVEPHPCTPDLLETIWLREERQGWERIRCYCVASPEEKERAAQVHKRIVQHADRLMAALAWNAKTAARREIRWLQEHLPGVLMVEFQGCPPGSSVARLVGRFHLQGNEGYFFVVGKA